MELGGYWIPKNTTVQVPHSVAALRCSHPALCHGSRQAAHQLVC